MNNKLIGGIIIIVVVILISIGIYVYTTSNDKAVLSTPPSGGTAGQNLGSPIGKQAVSNNLVNSVVPLYYYSADGNFTKGQLAADVPDISVGTIVSLSTDEGSSNYYKVHTANGPFYVDKYFIKVQ